MMGQSLFEDIARQYREYSITALVEQSSQLGDPEAIESGQASEEQLAVFDAILAEFPDNPVTYDEMSGLWITGSEDAIERLFSDREAFLDALDKGEDPGI